MYLFIELFYFFWGGGVRGMIVSFFSSWSSYYVIHYTEKFQNSPPQVVLLWHIIDLKAIKTLQAKKKFYLSLKELKCRALPIMRVIIRDSFIWPLNGIHLIIKHLLLLSSYKLSSFQLKLTSSLAQNAIYITHWTLSLWTCHVCRLSDSLLYVGFTYICMWLNLVISSC